MPHGLSEIRDWAENRHTLINANVAKDGVLQNQNAKGAALISVGAATDIHKVWQSIWHSLLYNFGVDSISPDRLSDNSCILFDICLSRNYTE